MRFCLHVALAASGVYLAVHTLALIMQLVCMSC